MTRHIGGRVHRSRYADFYTTLMTIDTQTLDPKRDPMGAAILDYLTTGRAKTLTVMSSMFDDDEMPVDYLFRTTDSMPPLELKALEMTRGTTLDVGAGAGCHALALQQRGVSVKAIDVSPLSCEAMRRRGWSGGAPVSSLKNLRHFPRIDFSPSDLDQRSRKNPHHIV